jgi:hypothetical protein
MPDQSLIELLSGYDVTDGTGGLVARLKVHPDNSVGNVMVMDHSLRRQGIATALYDYAAKDRGVPRLEAGSYQTAEGVALRTAYDRRGDYLGGEAKDAASLNKAAAVKELYAKQGMPVSGEDRENKRSRLNGFGGPVPN